MDPYVWGFSTTDRNLSSRGYSRRIKYKLMDRRYEFLLSILSKKILPGNDLWSPLEEGADKRSIYLTPRFANELSWDELSEPVMSIRLPELVLENICIPNPSTHPCASRAVRLLLRSLGLRVVRAGAGLKVRMMDGSWAPLKRPFHIPIYRTLLNLEPREDTDFGYFLGTGINYDISRFSHLLRVMPVEAPDVNEQEGRLYSWKNRIFPEGFIEFFNSKHPEMIIQPFFHGFVPEQREVPFMGFNIENAFERMIAQ